jgi:hypothetical protein
MLVVIVGGISTLRDTQCGYSCVWRASVAPSRADVCACVGSELFGRKTVDQIFRYSHIERCVSCVGVIRHA